MNTPESTVAGSFNVVKDPSGSRISTAQHYTTNTCGVGSGVHAVRFNGQMFLPRYSVSTLLHTHT